MADTLGAWLKASIGQMEAEGRWGGMAALARAAKVDRQLLYDIRDSGRQPSQEKLQRIAIALGVSAPQIGAIIGERGASAAAVAIVAAVRADLETAVRRLREVEAELTSPGGGRTVGELLAEDERDRQVVERAQSRPPRKGRRAGGQG